MSDETPSVEKKAEAGPFRLIFTLSLAGLLSGLGIVGAYEVTLPRITANKKAALQAAIFEVVPGAKATQALELQGETLVLDEDESDPVAYGAYDDQGVFLGYAIPSSGPGFQDTIELIYGFDPKNQHLMGMRVLTSRETPGLGDKIVKDMHFVDQFETIDASGTLDLVKVPPEAANQVEAITGATISSRAVVKILNAGLAERRPQLPQAGQEPAYVAPAPAQGGAEGGQ